MIILEPFQALVENPNLPTELHNVICKGYLSSYDVAGKSDGHSKELLFSQLLDVHFDISRAVYQYPTLCKWLYDYCLYEKCLVVIGFVPGCYYNSIVVALCGTNC